MQLTTKYVKHKIELSEAKVKDYKSRLKTLSVHGYWSLGYYEGKLSVLEELLDDLEKIEEDGGCTLQEQLSVIDKLADVVSKEVEGIDKTSKYSVLQEILRKCRSQ